MSQSQIEEQIHQFLIDNFVFDNSVRIGCDASFMASGLMDSTGVLELIMWVEQGFDIQVEDEEVLPENFDSISNLAAYARRKQAAKLAAVA